LIDGFFVVNDWLATFEVRIAPFVNLKVTLDDAEVIKLGKKTDEEYPL
jgi:hypothetical protein